MYDAIVLGTGGIGRARLWGLDRVPAPGPGLAAEGRAQGPALVPPGIPDDAPVYLYETPGGVFYGFPPDAQGRNKVVEHTGGRPHPPAILARPLSPTRRDTHVGRYPIPPSWCRDFGQIGTLADCDTLGLSLHRTDRHPRRLRHPRFVTPPDRSTPSQTANPSCVRETRHFPGGIPHPPPILACSPSKLKLPRFRGQVSSSSSSRAARRS